MKTKGEIEAEISEAIIQFEIDYMGRGPKETRAHIVEDLVEINLTLRGMGRPRKLRFPVGLFIWLKLSSKALVNKGGV